MGVRKSSPLGLHLRLDEKFAPGFPRSGLPLRLVLPGPLGTPAWNIAAGLNRSAVHQHRTPAEAKAALEKFKKDLMAMQIKSREGQGKKAVMKLEESNLKPIPGAIGAQMRSDVAPLFKGMWDELEKDYKSRNDAAKGDSIGVASAYRSAAQDEKAWQRAFPKYYTNTLKQRLQTGDEFGEKALKIIYGYMNGKKAPPGFSGHTQGIAADLTTTEKGQTWSVNSNYEHQVGWQKTWLYKWLVANAAKHKFYQLKTETWHWEYHEKDPPRQCWGGRVKERPVPKTR